MDVRWIKKGEHTESCPDRASLERPGLDRDVQAVAFCVFIFHDAQAMIISVVDDLTKE